MGLRHEIIICSKYKTFLIALLIIFLSSNPTLFYLIGANHTISTEAKLKLVLLEKSLLGRRGKFKNPHISKYARIVWARGHRKEQYKIFQDAIEEMKFK